MTDDRHDTTTAGEDLERFRDDFGLALISAARERDTVRRIPAGGSRRRRAVAIGLAATAVAAALVVTGVPSPGDRDAPLLGVTPAEAAVQELRRSLHEGVLARRAETTQYGRTVQRRVEEDWTDLATRQQHVRVTGGGPRPDSEYWNSSRHERWTRTGARAPDGRQIVEHAADDAENISSAQSPAEEVDDLLARAREGDLVVVRRTVSDGTKVVVLEQRERCFATPDNSAGSCPDPAGPSRWPEGAPAGMRPATTFQTWWLEEGDTPRILRHENGAVFRGTTRRDVAYRVRYTRWDVLPATAEHRSLVRRPAFPADRFLVVDG